MDLVKPPPVFFSSCFTDPESERLRIRDRIQAITGGASLAVRKEPRPVWMAEDYPELRPESPWPAFDKVELCLSGVRAAECFVAVITTRHGSPIHLEGTGTVPSSFFEAELFEAAFSEKPAFIFLLKGNEPDPKLASLLRLLAPFFPNMNLQPVAEDEILRNVEQLIKHYQRPRWLRPVLVPPRLKPTVDALFRTRHRTYDIKSEPPPLRFLGGLFDPALPPPDPVLVESVLDRANKAQEHHARLTLLWFAIRALMGAPFHNAKYSNFLQLWEDAFGAWTTAGAWYGLHGHVDMGCLAALGSLTDVRVTQAKILGSSSDIPHGPLASEYYSIARLAGQSSEVFALALDHIQSAIERTRGDGVNETAIRASIYRETGHMDAALTDYEKVAEARRDQGGGPYGESLSELGYAMLLSGRVGQGIDLMERGLDLLHKEPPSGFQVRAMRKLAIGYARGARIIRALEVASAAHDLAVKIGAYDQIRRLERMAKWLDRHIPWRSHRN